MPPQGKKLAEDGGSRFGSKTLRLSDAATWSMSLHLIAYIGDSLWHGTETFMLEGASLKVAHRDPLVMAGREAAGTR